MANKDIKKLDVELHNFILAQSRFNQDLANAIDEVWKKLFPKSKVEESSVSAIK